MEYIDASRMLDVDGRSGVEISVDRLEKMGHSRIRRPVVVRTKHMREPFCEAVSNCHKCFVSRFGQGEMSCDRRGRTLRSSFAASI